MSMEKDEISNKYVTLTLEKELYALRISLVREILELNEITSIPQTPDYVRGIVNLRGTAVPVIDLRRKFGLPLAQSDLSTRVLIMEVLLGDEPLTVGLIADSVREVIEIDEAQIDPPPKMGCIKNSRLLDGITKHEGRFVLLLNADRIFAEDEVVALHGESREPNLVDATRGKEFAPAEETADVA